MPYISNTDQDRELMLDQIGVKKFEDLIAHIPQQLLLSEAYRLDKPLSELEMNKQIQMIASKNINVVEYNSFLGGGVYDHFIPAAVDNIISRPEFLTAYTPYQAEVSQGTLQAIYEYQTLICELTGQEIANAGMYDGATATVEAIFMAVRKNKLSKVLVSSTVNPAYLLVLKTYTAQLNIELVMIPTLDGITNIHEISNLIDHQTAAVVIQTPNYFGCIEDCFAIEKTIRTQNKALFISIVDPISLAILNAPSEYHADIVVGEAQSLGNKLNFGGPLLGFMATNMDLSKSLPGRIIGATTDINGNRAFVLTIQTREQHIRRDKATSNICSNEALCSLASTVYMCLLGKQGLREVAELCVINAHYLAKQISRLNGYSLSFHQPFFKEFVINTPVNAQIIIDQLSKQKILPGLKLDFEGWENKLLIAVTEKKSQQEIDSLVRALQGVKNE